MIDWRTFATPDELARVAELEDRRASATVEIKAIRDRCYKRASRANGERK